MRATFIVHEIGIGLRRNLIMTLAMVITTAVSLGFLGTAVLFNQQVSVMITATCIERLRRRPWPRLDRTYRMKWKSPRF